MKTVIVIDTHDICFDSNLPLQAIHYTCDDSDTKKSCKIGHDVLILEFCTKLIIYFTLAVSATAQGMADSPFSVLNGVMIVSSDSLLEFPVNQHFVLIHDKSDPCKIYGNLLLRSINVKNIRPPMFLHNHIRKQGTPLFIGHRGSGANHYGSLLRENTIESFQNAMGQKGIIGIELDVSFTADKQLVVYHDLEFPAKLVMDNGNIVEDFRVPLCSLNYASLCNGGKRDPPLLEQVMRSLHRDTAGIVIELKYVSNSYARKRPEFSKYTREDLVEAVLDCIQTNWQYVASRWIIFSSFDPDICLYLRKTLPNTNAMIVHNLWLGHECDDEDNTVDFNDVRNRSWKVALAQSSRSGVALEADYVLSNKFLSDIKDTSSDSTLLLSYGRGNLQGENIEEQHKRGVGAFFIDDMKLADNYK